MRGRKRRLDGRGAFRVKAVVSPREPSAWLSFAQSSRLANSHGSAERPVVTALFEVHTRAPHALRSPTIQRNTSAGVQSSLPIVALLAANRNRERGTSTLLGKCGARR